MFYSHELLNRRTGRFGLIWWAAQSMNKKKLDNKKLRILAMDVERICDDIAMASNTKQGPLRKKSPRKSPKKAAEKGKKEEKWTRPPVLSLRLLAHLLYGTSLVHDRQWNFLLFDANHAFIQAKESRKAGGGIDLKEKEHDRNLMRSALSDKRRKGVPDDEYGNWKAFDKRSPSVLGYSQADVFGIGSYNTDSELSRWESQSQNGRSDAFTSKRSDITMMEPPPMIRPDAPADDDFGFGRLGVTDEFIQGMPTEPILPPEQLEEGGPPAGDALADTLAAWEQPPRVVSPTAEEQRPAEAARGEERLRRAAFAGAEETPMIVRDESELLVPPAGPEKERPRSPEDVTAAQAMPQLAEPQPRAKRFRRQIFADAEDAMMITKEDMKAMMEDYAELLTTEDARKPPQLRRYTQRTPEELLSEPALFAKSNKELVNSFKRNAVLRTSEQVDKLKDKLARQRQERAGLRRKKASRFEIALGEHAAGVVEAAAGVVGGEDGAAGIPPPEQPDRESLELARDRDESGLAPRDSAVKAARPDRGADSTASESFGDQTFNRIESRVGLESLLAPVEEFAEFQLPPDEQTILAPPEDSAEKAPETKRKRRGPCGELIEDIPLPFVIKKVPVRREQLRDDIEMLCEESELDETTFRKLCPPETTSRAKAAKKFCVLMHLLKDKAVEVEQSQPYGEITLKLGLTPDQQAMLDGEGEIQESDKQIEDIILE